ncbi:hypothetical protein CRG98_031016 [Punica granatum]|uniref:Uncharacterized protein n=1 Tax=Punica granatum TaxID=22663 RepID=A0A2I0IX70_PUNGR|nr:hypothetical protein CRG98_031016 [Punica granatum]
MRVPIPPFQERATDACEKESPLPIYDPKVEGRNNYANYRMYNKTIEIPKVDEMGHANETRTRTDRPLFTHRSRCFGFLNA